ncbi:MAG TPA: A/G-specific adenine glycosylase, partial [bacterium]|nr:A/G-specific adenine glycosylase [bacterium]
MAAAVPPGLTAALLTWFSQAQRSLPWRDDPQPYAVWISEIMLQQTQVEAVLPYFRSWMERFPTLDAVARAPLQEVLKAWEGLGYYTRARNLHRCARLLVERHGGALPRDLAALRELPGVGPYTAGALASIAFNQPVPLVDGNVARVLARLFALPHVPGSLAGRRDAWAWSQALLQDAVGQGGPPRAFNQALMELGALICRPKGPRCLLCPLRQFCQAQSLGTPEAFPRRAPRRARPIRQGVLALAIRPGVPPRALLRRRPSRGLWGGLWEFPWTETKPAHDTAAAVDALLRELLPNMGGITPPAAAHAAGLVPQAATPPAAPALLGHISHGLTHFHLELDCLLVRMAGDA